MFYAYLASAYIKPKLGRQMAQAEMRQQQGKIMNMCTKEKYHL